ncbi:Arm DNA-binding domain-containing protein [Novosphingobium terrae]|uniref:Arm DNA-binding domain-containing protein n=1 Tax=Novosphingobium terrae TaxID=2726189 RepID=UPI00197D7E8E|nr:Arm DNA-binding domain-containing protein [Novosphingobium terrae]
MTKKISFTPVTIDSLARGSLADPLTPGLAIEVLPSGKKRWYYRRKIAGRKVVATLFGELYPSMTIADARAWARGLNDQVEAGIDPRVTLRKAKSHAQMTVAFAHGLYMEAVRDGRISRRQSTLKPNSIRLKLGYYRRDIAPKLGSRSIYDITENELIELVEAKGKTAKVGANGLAAELRVFFGWACFLTGKEVGLSATLRLPIQRAFLLCASADITAVRESDWPSQKPSSVHRALVDRERPL